MPNFENVECPECKAATVEKVPSQTGGWYWRCHRHVWNGGNCQGAWHQDGRPYDGALFQLRKRGFWSRLFGG